MKNNKEEITSLDDVGVLVEPMPERDMPFASLTIQTVRHFTQEHGKNISQLTEAEKDLCIRKAIELAKKDGVFIPEFYHKYL